MNFFTIATEEELIVNAVVKFVVVRLKVVLLKKFDDRNYLPNPKNTGFY